MNTVPHNVGEISIYETVTKNKPFTFKLYTDVFPGLCPLPFFFFSRHVFHYMIVTSHRSQHADRHDEGQRHERASHDPHRRVD